MKKQEVFLTDTTLRDGEQGCGFALGVQEKTRLAMLLDNAGFYQIEAGIPAMGTCEKDAISHIMDICNNAKVAVWNRMCKEDIAHSFDCKPDVIHISVPVSDILIQSLLKKDRAYVVKTLIACVDYAKDKGYDVTVGFQDASRADVSFMVTLSSIMQKLGVLSVRLADTVGILTPMQARELLLGMTAQTDMVLGIHTHNDLGMAIAVAVEAVNGGAKFVDTTLFGIGERAGNCDAYTFLSLEEEQWETTPKLEDVLILQSEARQILFPRGEKKAWG